MKILSKVIIFFVCITFTSACFFGTLEKDKPVRDELISPDGTPAVNARSITFRDKDIDENQIEGVVTIAKSDNESVITSYRLYWGSSATVKLAGQDMIADIAVTGNDVTHAFGMNQGVPTGATHLLVYSANDKGEIAAPLALDIPDIVIKQIDTNNGLTEADAFCVFNGYMYFGARDMAGNDQLYRYDGVNPVAPITSFKNNNHHIEYMAVHKDELYFEGYDANNGRELWKYNGTDLPALVKNINNNGDSVPQLFTVYNNYLYFKAIDDKGGSLLHKCDSNNDITPVTDNSYGEISDLKVIDGKLYFVGSSVGNGMLYVIDGSNPPDPAVNEVKAIDRYIGYNNKIYIMMHINNIPVINPPHPDAIWSEYVYDEVNRIQEVNAISVDGFSDNDDFLIFNEKLYYVATKYNEHNLWLYTEGAAPVLVTSLYTGATGLKHVGETVVYENKLYFNGNMDGLSNDLCVYDGLSQPRIVGPDNIDLNPNTFFEYNGKLYFNKEFINGINGLYVYYEK